MYRSDRWTLALASALLLVIASSAQANVRVTYPEIAFEKYRLEQNGLEVILHENHALPIVAVNVWYHAGPINEDPGRTGFAHLFEHLMFQGSGHIGDDQHFKLLEAAGASSVNGTTSYDRTNYFETVPANQLELALWLESDRMGFLLEALTYDKLQNQRDVVMNERRQSIENRPYGPSYEKLIQTLFEKSHPYYGAVIGSMDDLRAASLDDVKKFFTNYYAPANATLVVAGDFETIAVKGLVERYFGSLTRRETPTAREVATAPITEQRREQVPEPVMLPQIQIGWLSPPFLKSGDAEADILAFILGAGKSSRLHRKLVYELELAQSVHVGQDSNALTSIFEVTVTGRPGIDIAQLEAEIWKLLEAARQTSPSDKEITRARNMLVTSSLSSLQRIGRVADRLNSYNHYTGDPGYLAYDLARYDAVTPEGLALLAKDLLDPTECAVVITVPQTGVKSAGNQMRGTQ